MRKMLNTLYITKVAHIGTKVTFEIEGDLIL